MTKPETDPTAQAGVRETAEALVKKLRLIHDDPRYRAVFQIAQLHHAPYSGPTYVAELSDLEAALAAQPAQTTEAVGIKPLIATAREFVRFPNTHFHYKDGADVMGALCDALEATLAPAPPSTRAEPVSLKLVGYGREGGKLVRVEVLDSDERIDLFRPSAAPQEQVSEREAVIEGKSDAH